MPTLEGLEEAGLEKIPDLSIAKMRFELTLDSNTAKELKIDQAAVSFLFIHQICPLLSQVCTKINSRSS